MRRGIGLAVLSATVGLVLPLAARAQVAGFSPQQQATLMIYQQQIRSQQLMQQQRQMQAVRQQLIAQQQQIGQTQRMQQQAFDTLFDPNDPNQQAENLAMGRHGTAVFGDMHFYSSQFNRIQPYYNYNFVARRNRPVPITLNNNRGLPTSGFGGIIFGGNFGFLLPY